MKHEDTMEFSYQQMKFGGSGEVLEAYTPMTVKEIAVHFDKTENAVRVGISRMIKTHPEWKSKNEKGQVIVLASGVEWLDTEYFRQKNEVILVDEEKIRLQEKVAAFDEILKISIDQAVSKAQASFLLEQQSKDNEIQNLKKEKEMIEQQSAEKIEKLSQINSELETKLNKIPRILRKLLKL